MSRSPVAAALLLSSLVGLACHPAGASRAPAGTPARPDAPRAEPAPLTLDHAFMREFLEDFAADDMRGRYTLVPADIERAADMIAQQYDALGLAGVGPRHRSRFQFAHGSEPELAHHVWIEIDGHAHVLGPEQSVSLTTADARAVVAEPLWLPASTRAPDPPLRERVRDHVVLFSSTPTPTAVTTAAAAMREAGARAIAWIGDPTALDADALAALRDAARDTALPQVVLARAPMIAMVKDGGTQLDAIEQAGKPAALPRVRLSLAPRRRDRLHDADNVLAVLPGTDAADEIVVIGAHYDHIGRKDAGLACIGSDDTCNGADDNGSGTAMVLSIAKAFAAAGRRPRRTLVFAHFAGEELGLHGSKALANTAPDAPPFRGGHVVAMINFDMVGRLGSGGLSIGGVGSSTGWMPLLDRLGSRGMSVVYERSVSARSDQAPFYELGIPVLFFFTGLHDDYHRADDEADRINYDGMNTIGDLALALVEAVAGGAELPFAAATGDDGLVTRMPGSDERTVEKRVGPP
ncbi:MAG: M20/M25/M40 family metallo-hydrolase [Deltaproteobacteria bacterium]|nr:M20/M25/M40 family metallo-hydrolase [Deltaproteobacteria bacterium]MBK8236734.1 M20/M25/M40 family metallo-hydrolase [Deltaproteobacteria bacterium]MBK8720028.1 M20/M25/M40 family metallo-hydrolase [Deltaproteobacteria bacterium]MBP7292288.1 M20/M25/M40 family metallo-hydrolase [Nannocystaceae bacterium]